MRKSILFIIMSLLMVFNLLLTFQNANMGVTSASSTQKLFVDGTSEYAVLKSGITKGKIYSFFGYEWKVVNVTDEIATFWMTTPYRTSKFNDNELFGANPAKDYIWNNGYKDGIWNGQSLGDSTVRKVLMEDIEIQFKKQNGWDKVVPGAIAGINDMNASINIDNVYYRKDKSTNYTSIPSDTFYANLSLGNDKLWLPSENEIRDGGVWKLDDTYRNWSDTSNAKFAWLRTPIPEYSHSGVLVGYNKDIDGMSSPESIFRDYISFLHGVRPAVHLNIVTEVTITEPTVSANLIEGSTANVIVAPVTANYANLGQVKYSVIKKDDPTPTDDMYSLNIPTIETLVAGDYKLCTKFFLKDEFIGEYKNDNYYEKEFKVNVFSDIIAVNISSIIPNSILTVGDSNTQLLSKVNLNVAGVGSLIYAVVEKNAAAPLETDYSTTVPTIGDRKVGTYTVYCKYIINDMNNTFYSDSNIAMVDVNIVKKQEPANPGTSNQDIMKYILIGVCVIGVISVIAVVIIVSRKRKQVL